MLLGRARPPLQMPHNICRFKSFKVYPMKPVKVIVYLLLAAVISTSTISCSLFNNLFGPKYGCPSNGKNVGAERILSGEKVPKAPKFKS